MDIESVIGDFILYLKYERGRSENTCSAYRRDLDQFADYLREAGVTVPSRTTIDHVVDFMRDRLAAMADRSQSRKLVVLRNFFKYLHEEDLHPKNIATLISATRPWRKLPKAMTHSDADALVQSPRRMLDKAGDGSPQNALLKIRDIAILAFLYSTGARVSEACDLRMDWLHFKEGVVRVEGKGAKQRIVPIGEVATAAIREYLDTVRPKLDKHGAPVVFLTRNGNRLSRQQIFRLVKRYAMAAGITTSVSPHTFRHSCATHMLEGGAHLRAVQTMLGHVDISSTEIYTHVDQKRLLAAHRKFHPRHAAGE